MRSVEHISNELRYKFCWLVLIAPRGNKSVDGVIPLKDNVALPESGGCYVGDGRNFLRRRTLLFVRNITRSRRRAMFVKDGRTSIL